MTAPNESTQKTDDALLTRIAGAQRIISELCTGTRRWTMSVPARVNDDPDIVLSETLRDCEREILALRARVAELEREQNGLSADYATLLKSSDNFERERDALLREQANVRAVEMWIQQGNDPIQPMHYVTGLAGTRLGAFREDDLACESATSLAALGAALRAPAPQTEEG